MARPIAKRKVDIWFPKKDGMRGAAADARLGRKQFGGEIGQLNVLIWPALSSTGGCVGPTGCGMGA